LSLEYVYAEIILQNKTKMVFSSPSALKGAWQQGVYFDHDQQQWTDSVQGRLLECPLLAGIEWDLLESQGKVSGRECQLLKLE